MLLGATNQCQKTVRDHNETMVDHYDVSGSLKYEKGLGARQDILFAYLYGSSVNDPGLFGSDIDVAVISSPQI